MRNSFHIFFFLCVTFACKNSGAQECPSKILFYIDNLDKNELPVRYLPQLKQLCAGKGLEMQTTLLFHERGKTNEQLQRETSMNSCIEKKFGRGFREKLISKADSIFIATSANTVVEFDYCDYWPHPKDEPEDQYKTGVVDPGRNVAISRKMYGQLPSDEDDNKPTVTISFLVSKQGTVSNIKRIETPYADIKNKELLLKLQAIIKKQIMAESPWIPGKVAGHNVNTKYILTINFVPPDDRKTITLSY